MYRNSVDAFVQLVSGGQVSEISVAIGYLTNGIRYCSVQVGFGDGSEYYIEAYEQEAEDLYKEATRRSTELRVAVTH
jgi:hypothetical protein